MVGYVYVLHFDEPYRHAGHYVGCTTMLRERLTTHALGRGANLIRVALEAGNEFTLTGLGACSHRKMRVLERQVKKWHGSADFCQTCAGDPRRIPGTTPYPIEAIGFPIRSKEIRMQITSVRTHYAGVTVRVSTPGDTYLSTQLKMIAKPEKDALGFIPAGGDAGLTGSLMLGRVALAFRGVELIGYCAWTENATTVKIHQCLVIDQERGSGIGRELVRCVQSARPGKDLQCKVRDDLSANDFWTAIGFRLFDTMTHETSGSKLNCYVHEYATFNHDGSRHEV